MKNCKKKVGLYEFYVKDFIEVDCLFWGCEFDLEIWCGFLCKGVLFVIGVVLGVFMVYGKYFLAGMIFVGLVQEDVLFQILGKYLDLIVLNDWLFNVEMLVYLLDDKFILVDKFFICNNGILLEEDEINVNIWILFIEGEFVC